MTVAYHLDRSLGGAVLAKLGDPARGNVVLNGHEFGQGATEALLRAELMAAKAGVIPSIMVDGQQGILMAQVGSALTKIDRADEKTRAVYLATHGAIRQAHQTAGQGHEWLWRRVEPTGAGNPMVIIVALVLGAALIIGTAYATTSAITTFLEVKADAAKDVALAGVAAQWALSGRAIDPQAWAILQTLAGKQRKEDPVKSAFPWLVVGGFAAAGAAIYFGGKYL